MADPERNPNPQVLDCAQSAQSTEINARPNAEYYKVVDQRLKNAGVTLPQVQIAILKVATQEPTLAFPGDVKILQDLTLKTVHILKERFSNLKILYITSRIYAGYADTALNPEPHAFETGFAVKWLIADQIAGQAGIELRSAPRRRPRSVDRLGPVFVGRRPQRTQGRIAMVS
jgi:hypothetical protein